MQNYMLHYSVEPQIHHITGKDSSFRQDVELLTLQIGKLNLSSHTKKINNGSIILGLAQVSFELNGLI